MSNKENYIWNMANNEHITNNTSQISETKIPTPSSTNKIGSHSTSKPTLPGIVDHNDTVSSLDEFFSFKSSSIYENPYSENNHNHNNNNINNHNSGPEFNDLSYSSNISNYPKPKTNTTIPPKIPNAYHHDFLPPLNTTNRKRDSYNSPNDNPHPDFIPSTNQNLLYHPPLDGNIQKENINFYPYELKYRMPPVSNETIENSRIRSLVENLKDIKPNYQSSMRKLLSTSFKDAKVINQTVHLYSNLLYNWREQTEYIYNKLKEAIATSEYQVENQVNTNQLLENVFNSQINSLKEHKLKYENNIVKMQEYIRKILPKIPSNSYNYETILNEKVNQIEDLKYKYQKINEIYQKSKVNGDFSEDVYKIKFEGEDNAKDIDEKMKEIIDTYVKICDLRSENNNKKDHGENKDKEGDTEGSVDKMSDKENEIKILCKSIKRNCDMIFFDLQNSNTLINFVNKEANNVVKDKNYMEKRKKECEKEKETNIENVEFNKMSMGGKENKCVEEEK